MEAEKLPKQKIQAQILYMVHQRGPEKTCCPSEVARKLDPKSWRNLMPAVRKEAISLAEKGQIDICQKGQPVSPMKFKGPIRLRMKRQRTNQIQEQKETS